MVVFRTPFMPLLFSCGTSQYLPPERQNPKTTDLHGVTPQLADNVPIFVPRRRILAYRESTLPHVGIGGRRSTHSTPRGVHDEKGVLDNCQLIVVPLDAPIIGFSFNQHQLLYRQRRKT